MNNGLIGYAENDRELYAEFLGRRVYGYIKELEKEWEEYLTDKGDNNARGTNTSKTSSIGL